MIWDSGEDEGFESGNILRILLSRLARKNGGGDERRKSVPSGVVFLMFVMSLKERGGCGDGHE